MKKLDFKYLPLDKIDISFLNVRKTNLEEGIEELKDSIKEIGIQQPVVVFPNKEVKGRYELIIGQRRYLAAKKMSLKEIPSLITTVKDETDATIKSFSENIHRLDLEYRDKMQVATALLNKFNNINDVAKHLGVSPQTVKNYIGYAAVPDDKQAVAIAKKIEEMPRSKDRMAVIDIAHENPNKPVKDIVKIVKKKSEIIAITINVTKKIHDALINASNEYQSEKEAIAKDALEEWLSKKGFI